MDGGSKRHTINRPSIASSGKNVEKVKTGHKYTIVKTFLNLHLWSAEVEDWSRADQSRSVRRRCPQNRKRKWKQTVTSSGAQTADHSTTRSDSLAALLYNKNEQLLVS